jgi:hypothetical protein
MKTNLLLVVMALAILSILTSCKKEKLEKVNPKKSPDRLKAMVDPGKDPLDMPIVTISYGKYLIKNRYTGEYLNFSHRISGFDDNLYHYYDYYNLYQVERNTGPIDPTYIWTITGSDGYYSFISANNPNHGIIYSSNKILVEANTSPSSFKVSRWSDDTNIANSTSLSGPYTISYEIYYRYNSAIFNCQNQSTINGYGIVDFTDINHTGTSYEPYSDWWSKDWYLIPASSVTLVEDNFAYAKNANSGSRYIYKMNGATAAPGDANQLQYNVAANWGTGWNDVDGNGYCGELSYTNVLNGVAGFGINLSISGAHVDISQAHGITFWASSDYGNDDAVSGPLAMISIKSANIAAFSGSGNFWHAQFPLTYNWKKYDFNFQRGPFTAPVNSTGQTFAACLQQATAIEFEQGITDNKAGKNLQGNIYVDDVELY